MDTGADISCISSKDWPSSWPVQTTAASLTGVGQASNVAQSATILQWKDGEPAGTFQPYVVPSLPFILWGRNILNQMGTYLISASDPVSQTDAKNGISRKKKKKAWKKPARVY